ncbi:MAG: penicillin-binding protein 1C [Rhizobiales bacterium 65-79]|jgi:penicillin-binding protein 1C|nr:penicillin-binding protein 1C [Hyphomicrobiales bacterium]OJU04380.1 MAG: penicillin-binding protein 1C [Rhizobiales bacterium 65-79]
MIRPFTYSLIAVALASLLCASAWVGLRALDRSYPPPLAEAGLVSTEIVDRDGNLLRAFATPEGRWRLATRIEDVDPKLTRMLIAYEDHRFYSHHGVDIGALFRAAGQLLLNGHIVSGGSTLSMQLARLVEPREERSIGAKLIQIVRALQIERRLTKKQILEDYLTLAPYGGNLEGVRAASLAYFGKEPKRLTVAEAALLVSLPQSPEARRPDRHPAEAKAARARVLERMKKAGIIVPREIALASAEPIPRMRGELPALAAQAAGDALRKTPSARRLQLTIDRGTQQRLEEVARETARRLGPKVSIAMILADAPTGDILGEVGSADFFDARRSGWIDMTDAERSPGSTLKPFIYGLAFEEGLIAQETMIEDRPADFGGYKPKNFDMRYQGNVTIRQALQMSLNVPAIRLLDAVGPLRLMARFREAGVKPALPRGEAPGLAIGLGGVGVTLSDLVQLYTAFPNGGRATMLHDRPVDQPTTARLLEPQAAWQVADILSGVRPPEGSRTVGIAYKTGTSYGYRDAWSIGFDGRHVLGVWVGRPDGGPVPGLAGYVSAAPILFDAFAKSGLAIAPLPRAPAGALRQARAGLPVTLRDFTPPGELPPVHGVPEPPPRIIFPPEGAHVELGSVDGGPVSPLVLKLQGGRAPFRWLANGKPLPQIARTRTSRWTPDGDGYSTLTVIDAVGRAASVSIYVQ